MVTKAAFGLALVLATVSGSLAATHTHLLALDQNHQTIYNPYGAHVGTDPSQGVRYELNRDGDRAHAN
jgi:hypothetical protein